MKQEIAKMSNDVYHKERFSFRFTNLSPDTAARLQRSLADFEITSRIPSVVSLALQESSNLQNLYAFLERESLDPGTYSVWAAVVTSSDHDGISLPSFILELVRRTFCGVDFSFVSCLDDEQAGGAVG